MKEKNKNRIWMIILLVLLALIILVPAALYVYLSYDHYHISDMRADYDINEPYSGKAIYLESGDVEVTLDSADLYWLMDEYDLLENEDIPSIEIIDTAAEIGDDALTLYADIKLWGFIPLPIKVDLSAKTGDTLQLTIEKVHIGKWIAFPAEKLARFGVDSNYTIEYDMLAGMQIKSIHLEKGQLVVVVPFLTDFSRQFEPDMTADTLLLYGIDSDSAINCASACYHAEDNSECQHVVCEYISGEQEPVEAMARMLALCDASLASKVIDSLDPVIARFLLPVSTQDVTIYRDTYTAMVADYNRKLETMLTALRQKYKELEVELTGDGYVDTATGKALSLCELCPELGLTDDQCHPVLLMATEPVKAADAASMPLFSEIPKSNDLVIDMALDYLSYDIGIILSLPDGSFAMLYYASTGELVVLCLPKATAESTFIEYSVPKLFNLDLAVLSALRVKHDAPAPDLSRYIVFLPWEIEAIWSAAQKQGV